MTDQVYVMSYYDYDGDYIVGAYKDIQSAEMVMAEINAVGVNQYRIEAVEIINDMPEIIREVRVSAYSGEEKLPYLDITSVLSKESDFPRGTRLWEHVVPHPDKAINYLAPDIVTDQLEIRRIFKSSASYEAIEADMLKLAKNLWVGVQKMRNDGQSCDEINRWLESVPE